LKCFLRPFDGIQNRLRNSVHLTFWRQPSANIFFDDLWPAERENPLGWKDAGKSGLKDDCLAYVKEVWTDMRPLSLRKKMDKVEK